MSDDINPVEIWAGIKQVYVQSFDPDNGCVTATLNLQQAQQLYKDLHRVIKAANGGQLWYEDR